MFHPRPPSTSMPGPMTPYLVHTEVEYAIANPPPLISLQRFYADIATDAEEGDALPEPGLFRDFGGAGDCGPSSLSGVMNILGVNIDGYFGGATQLRRVIVERARQRPEVLDSMLNFFPIQGLEVRNREGLRTVYTPQEYLDHIIAPGANFDELSWALVAETLDLQVIIHRVSIVSIQVQNLPQYFSKHIYYLPL